jgi:hypothetical protein
MERAAETAHAEHEARIAYRDLFRKSWDIWGTGKGDTRRSVPLDLNWAQSLDNFREAGLPDWELSEGVTVALTNEKLKPENKFRYFCGICWTKIRKMQADAKAIIGIPDVESDDPDDSEQNRVAVRVLEAWKAKRTEAGLDSTEKQDFNLEWQAGSWHSTGVGVDELLAAAELAAERRTPAISNYFGEGMHVVEAVRLYFLACQRLHHVTYGEASLARNDVFALMEMILPTFETVSRAVNRLGEIAEDAEQARVLSEVALAMVSPRDRLDDLFPGGYQWTWNMENQVEWPPVMWRKGWTPSDLPAPAPLPVWCGACDGEELHMRWAPLKVTQCGTERTVLERCLQCHPSMLVPAAELPAWCGECDGDELARRWVEAEDGLVRCPRCNPHHKRARDMAQS